MTIADSSLTGVVRATDSVLVITGSVVVGRSPAGTTPSTPALAATRATVVVADSALRGGDGVLGMGAGQPPSAAISATASEIALSCRVAGGTNLVTQAASLAAASQVLSFTNPVVSVVD